MPGDNTLIFSLFRRTTFRLNIPAESFRKGYAVSGSEASEKIRLLVKTVNHTRKQLDSITDAYDNLEDVEGTEAEQLIASYQEILRSRKKIAYVSWLKTLVHLPAFMHFISECQTILYS